MKLAREEAAEWRVPCDARAAQRMIVQSPFVLAAATALPPQVATTCLFLASKVEETPKKLRDVIVETYKVQHSTVQPPEGDQELWRLKEQVLICERELLRVLGFDLSIEHAYRPLLGYVKSISGPRDLAQIAWNFINDSLRTTVCLQYAPRCLAAAAAWMASSYLEAKQRPFPLPQHHNKRSGMEEPWYSAFQVSETTVRAIVQQIQQMYDDNKGGTGGGVLLANSGAVERMRMQPQRSLGASPSAPATREPSREPSRQGSAGSAGAAGGGSGADAGSGAGGGSAAAGGSSAAGGAGKRDEARRERDPSAVKREEGGVKRDGDGRASMAAPEEGEIEEGELAPPPNKRPKEEEA
mmetsp:Transcript_39304/g.103644  ORF Transcript_39304/g.103644 Transcript_39304/m.103644 type:complete len:354 (+) Transcript_39304:510-1571(+)